MRIILHSKQAHIIFTACLVLLFCNGSSQVKDTAETTPRPRRFLHNIFQQAVGAVTVAKKDSANKATIINSKSESLFQRYNGKIIRHIITQELGFEKTFTDTSRRINYFGTRILNAMHRNTRSWVIRNNLFIKEYSVLNSYLLSDNERWLRSLNFIQDARILVQPIKGTYDSVDIVVITKDFFSITGSLDVNGIKRVRAKLAENNLMGMGQRVQFTALVDKSRGPAFGYELLYSQNSIANTFINGTIGYTLINTGRSDGAEDEKAFYIRLDRPLVSAFSRLAGGVEFSYNHSENFYLKPDSLFYDYRYNLYDVWGGINLGVTKLLNSKDRIRDRSFFALRYIRNHFVKSPFQIGELYNQTYNSRQALLAEFTLFRQDFYKTNYIYGFGSTEDIPYGFNIALTGGWYQQLKLGRPYAGVNANYFIATKKGEFMQLFARSGGFLNKKKWQDANIMAGANIYSRLYLYKNVRIREYIRFSYTRQFNRLTFDPLRIDNPYGLREFRSDSVLGSQRISLYAETFAFTKHKLFGFQFAPFLFTDFSLLSPEKEKIFRSGLYAGLGGGIRTRNENFIFGTIEMRMIYFPNKGDRNNTFKIAFQSNLRFRFISRYIKPPDIIQLNVGDQYTY